LRGQCQGNVKMTRIEDKGVETKVGERGRDVDKTLLKYKVEILAEIDPDYSIRALILNWPLLDFCYFFAFKRKFKKLT